MGAFMLKNYAQVVTENKFRNLGHEQNQQRKRRVRKREVIVECRKLKEVGQKENKYKQRKTAQKKSNIMQRQRWTNTKIEKEVKLKLKFSKVHFIKI